MATGHSILLIEDDTEVAAEIIRYFRELGLAVEHIADGAAGLARALSNDVDLVILDVMLPGKNGFDICRELRSAKPLVSVIMLTTRTSEVDKVLGFELGADDYVAKPFQASELLARVRSKLRRMASERAVTASGPEDSGPVLKVGDLEVDTDRCTLHKRGELVKLSAKEYELLCFLMRHPGRVFSKRELLESVWGVEIAGYEDAVVSMVRRLRIRIEDDPAHPAYLLNNRGIGYSFVERSKYGKDAG